MSSRRLAALSARRFEYRIDNTARRDQNERVVVTVTNHLQRIDRQI